MSDSRLFDLVMINSSENADRLSSPTSGIYIVGLGPGNADDITRKVWKFFQSTAVIYVRTAQHPAVMELQNSLPALVHSFDHVYQEAEDFTAVYLTIAEKIVSLGKEGPVIYAVPGHPMMGEATVNQIKLRAEDAGIPLTILPGLSFVEPSLTALNIDGLDGLQIFDALEIADFAYAPINVDMPALLGQVYNARIASALKLKLSALYPREHQAALLHNAGMRDEIVEWLPLFEIDHSDHINHLTTLFLPALPESSSLPALADTVATLRSPGGCPWDIEQTSKSLRATLQEEAAEVLDAIDQGDSENLREELGDLLLHILMQAQIAAEDGLFTLSEVIAGINAKLIRRHPHVWGDVKVSDSEEVISNWEQLKANEKNGSKRESLLEGIPVNLPALARSQKIQKRVAQAGFDWPDSIGVFEKLQEEIIELQQAQTEAERRAELGDILFVAANLAKWMGVDAETALREANLRFIGRFQTVEELAKQQQLILPEASAEQLLDLWHEAKRLESGHG